MIGLREIQVKTLTTDIEQNSKEHSLYEYALLNFALRIDKKQESTNQAGNSTIDIKRIFIIMTHAIIITNHLFDISGKITHRYPH